MDTSACVNEHGNLQFDLPFRDSLPMPDNRFAVYKRTFNTLTRLKKDPTKLTQCLEVLGRYLSDGHVEQVGAENLDVGTGNSWHLPVFPVQHPKKKKCRIVFDSSAVYQGVSLNSKLYQGPDNNNLLLGVLMRFRIGEIGYSCDIKSMFHCFFVNPSHRKYLRFYWFSENNPSNDVVLFQANVHVFGNCCSPAIANHGLRFAASNSPCTAPPSSVEFLRRSMYVDDGLSSASTPEEATATLKGAVDLLAHYNITVHEINSSSPEVRRNFHTSDETHKVVCANTDGTSSALGILWQINTDHLALRSEFSLKPFTKRGILSANGANFDPLGISAPVTLGGRLFQRMLMPAKSSTMNTWADYGWDYLLQYGAKRWRRVQLLAKQVWHRWRTKHLHTLQARRKKKVKPNLKPGDIVLVKEKSKRNDWPVRTIIDVRGSEDDLVRAVTVKIPGKNARILDRAVFNVVLLT